MDDSQNTELAVGRGVLDIVRGLQSKSINPTELSADERRQCVAHFRGEGMTTAETAKILRVTDRTIRRDQQVLAEANALKPDTRLGEIYAGHLRAEAELAVSRIRRVTRDKDTPPVTRVEGERAAYEITDKLVHRLQSMGYLPTAAQRIDAEMTHHVRDLTSVAEIQAELDRMASIESRVVTTQHNASEPVPNAEPADGGGS